MTTRLRLVPLALALIVALTSLTMAVARGQGRPVGEMVVCLGLGTISVPVDAEGRPTGPVHLCPDAAPALFVDAGLVLPPATAPQGLGLRLAVVQKTAATGRNAPAARARGPPAPV